MKKRLDSILFELGLFETKNKAASSILAGDVLFDTKAFKKAGEMFDEDEFKEKIAPHLIIKKEKYVSRGGLKLEHAIKTFNINIKDRVCIDLGASTGGFTDCMLQFGAKKVYAIDCGYNQMNWKIKTDERVVNIEKTNARLCKRKDIYKEGDEIPTFLSMDLSFISIKKVLDNAKTLVDKDCEMVLLIKPQFEAERCDIQKGGVVKDLNVHEKIKDDIKDYAKSLGLNTLGIIESPILGNKSGNIEYLIYLKGKDVLCP